MLLSINGAFYRTGSKPHEDPEPDTTPTGPLKVLKNPSGLNIYITDVTMSLSLLNP